MKIRIFLLGSNLSISITSMNWKILKSKIWCVGVCVFWAMNFGCSTSSQTTGLLQKEGVSAEDFDSLKACLFPWYLGKQALFGGIFLNSIKRIFIPMYICNSQLKSHSKGCSRLGFNSKLSCLYLTGKQMGVCFSLNIIFQRWYLQCIIYLDNV